MMANACAWSTKLFRTVAVGLLHAEREHETPRDTEDRRDLPGRLHVERRHLLRRSILSVPLIFGRRSGRRLRPRLAAA
jgi:hypothetical protein